MVRKNTCILKYLIWIDKNKTTNSIDNVLSIITQSPKGQTGDREKISGISTSNPSFHEDQKIENKYALVSQAFLDHVAVQDEIFREIAWAHIRLPRLLAFFVLSLQLVPSDDIKHSVVHHQ